MFPLFETIRIENGKVLHIDYHQQRLAKYAATLDLTNYIYRLNIPLKGIFKLKIVYNNLHFIHHEIVPYTERKIESLHFVHDNSVSYDKKSTDRALLDNLSKLKNGCDEILIIQNGLITDTSFSNILFYKSNRWITPSKPLLKGTCLTRLLNQDTISSDNIHIEDIEDYQKFMLINAMLDFDEQRAITFRRCHNKLLSVPYISFSDHTGKP